MLGSEVALLHLLLMSVFVAMQASNGEQLGDGAEGTAITQDDGVKVHCSGFPRIIKAGHGVKLGAVVCRVPIFVSLPPCCRGQWLRMQP